MVTNEIRDLQPTIFFVLLFLIRINSSSAFFNKIGAKIDFDNISYEVSGVLVFWSFGSWTIFRVWQFLLFWKRQFQFSIICQYFSQRFLAYIRNLSISTIAKLIPEQVTLLCLDFSERSQILVLFDQKCWNLEQLCRLGTRILRDEKDSAPVFCSLVSNSDFSIRCPYPDFGGVGRLDFGFILSPLIGKMEEKLTRLKQNEFISVSTTQQSYINYI